jgi:hypothetical protein
MAAALVPLALSLAPEIINLITGLVHKHATVAQVAKVPNTGPVAFADVLSAVGDDLSRAHAAGQITGPIPEDAIVKVIIQAVVTSMKMSGLLGTPALPGISTTPGSQSLVLKLGDTLSIKVAA